MSLPSEWSLSVVTLTDPVPVTPEASLPPGSKRYVWNADGTSSELDADGNVLRTNLAKNPSVEDGLTGWSVYAAGAGADMSFSTVEYRSGTRSVLSGLRGASTTVGPEFTMGAPVSTGTQITVTTHYKANWAMAGYAVEYRGLTGSSKFSVMKPTVVVLPDGWTQAVFTFTTDRETQKIRTYYTGNLTAASRLYMDDVQVEVGDTATPYFDGDTPPYIAPLPPPPPPPPAPNWHGPRVASWRIELLDTNGNIVADEKLKVITKSLNWEADRPVHGGGQVSIGGTYDTESLRELLSGRRLRPVYTLNGDDHHLGLFKATTTPAKYGTGTRQTRDVSIVEAGMVTGRTIGSYTLPVATHIVDTVTSLVTARGLPVSLVDSDATLRTEMSWPDATPLHDGVINALLAAAGYTPLRPGVDGVLMSAPFVPASQRPVVYDFRNDSRGIYKPEFEIDSNWLSVPNRVRVVARSSSEAPPLIGYAQDNNPQSPWSFVNRGEWVEESINDGVDVTSQEAVNAIAAMELAARQQEAATLRFECAWIPHLRIGAVVGFHNTRHRLSGLWEVSGIDWPGGSLVRVTARSVA